jgi:hypothetical protein
LRLDWALGRRVRVGHVETDESSTAPLPVDAHRRMRLSDGTPDAFEARSGGIPDAERAPDEPEDWSADGSPARRPLSSSGDSSEDEYKAEGSFARGNLERRSLIRARTSLELRGEDVSSADPSDDERVLVERRLAEVRSRLRGETARGLPPLQVGHVTATDDKDGAPPAARRGEEGSPDCRSAGRLGDGPELEGEGEVAVETKRAHGWQFDVNAGAEKICDGDRCGRICSEERETGASCHRQTWCAQLPPFIFGSTTIVLFHH